MRIASILVAIGLALALCGCWHTPKEPQTVPGYDLDTTPGCDGSDWVQSQKTLQSACAVLHVDTCNNITSCK